MLPKDHTMSMEHIRLSPQERITLLQIGDPHCKQERDQSVIADLSRSGSYASLRMTGVLH